MSNVVKIKEFSIENGEGIRTSIFFSGCEFKCKGCFNKDLWDFNVGEKFTKEVYKTKIKPTINEHVAGISILGGEPLHPNNIGAVCDLVRWFNHDFPNKNIWLWTGYKIESFQERCSYEQSISKVDAISLQAILKNIDILVDGQFVEDQKELTLKWRGSCNQRVVDMKKTLKTGEVVLYV